MALTIIIIYNAKYVADAFIVCVFRLSSNYRPYTYVGSLLTRQQKVSRSVPNKRPYFAAESPVSMSAKHAAMLLNLFMEGAG